MQSFDNRKYGRSYLNSIIEYVLNPFAPDETFEGALDNISERGLCLITSNLLGKGQEITIISPISAPSETATVRWIEKYDDFHYKVGLEFV